MHCSRRHLSISCLLLAAICVSHSIAKEQRTSHRPNVLFIAVDDLRPALGCYGDPVAKTPNIDRLASRGTVFNRAYCQQAVCSPSRLSLLTGRRPDTIRVWDLKTHFRETIPDLVTLPQHFKNQGYHAQSIGKIYHGGGKPAKDPPSWSAEPKYDYVRDSKLRYALPKNLVGTGLKRSAVEAAEVPDEHYIDGLVCNDAIETLESRKREEQPFFLAIGFRKPHLPFCAPQKYWDLYDRSKIPLPSSSQHPTGAPEIATRSWRELEGYTDIPQDAKLAEAKVRELRHGYYACVSYVDALIGRLLETLKRLELEDNTVIVLWGDHGFHLGEQNLWTKANNYELSTRVPLIVSVPGERPATCNALVELVDLYPTLADVCNLKPPVDDEGTSFKALLTSPTTSWKQAVFSQFPRAREGHRHQSHGDIMGYTVRTNRFRYVEWRTWGTQQAVARELYDHESDQDETQNVAARSEYADAMRDLEGILKKGWKAAVPKRKEPKPNVLFLAVDDMKDWVNCLGGYEGTVHTPNIDRLARRGMLFTNAHCASPKCAPSRAAVMTGLRPSTTGLYDNGHWWLPNQPDAVTIPVHFRNHGYRVAGAGKIFHHTAGNHPPNQWDDFLQITFRNDPWFRGSKLNYPWSESGPFPDNFPFGGVKGLGHENDWGNLDIPDRDYDDALTTEYAIRFLGDKSRASGWQPFFLACGIFRPHLPWYVPKEFFERYSLDDIVLPNAPESDLDDLPAEGLKFAAARRKDFSEIKKSDRYRHAIRAYLASITYADAQLGRVLDALKVSPHARDTIVVLWSDHGWHLGEKQHWHKTTLWEEATRVPLIVSVPGFEPGVCNRAVSLIDLYPTLNELCELSYPQKLDGISLVPLLKNATSKWNRPAVVEFKRGNAAVRSERYRYIRYRDGGEELYDHESDPLEHRNLASKQQFEPIKKELADWIVNDWAESAPTKSSFTFDPQSFTWTEKETGKVTHGKVR